MTLNILRILRNRPQLAETIFVPLFWALYAVYRLFRDKQFVLNNFLDRPVSIASYDGVAVALRVHAFYQAIGVAVLVFLGMLLLVQKLLPRVRTGELRLLQATSVAGLVFLFFALVGADMRASMHLLAAFQGAVIVSAGCRHLMKARISDEAHILISGWLGALGISVGIIARVFLSDKLPLPSLPESLFVTMCIGWAILYYLQRQPQHADNQGLGLIRQTSGLLAAPLLLVLAAELHMAFGFSYTILRGVLLLLLAASLFRRQRRAAGLVAVQEQFFNRTLPLFLAGILGFAYYRPILDAQVDLFEDANRILPLMQWHAFGKIPFLDSFSSHALSDWCWGGLYNLLNGYNAYGTYAYGFLLHVLIALTTYWFTWKVWGNGWLALFLALFYPYTHVLLPEYYHFVPISVVLLLPIANRPDRKHFVLLFSWMFFLMLWRLDVGLSNSFATAALVVAIGFAGDAKRFFLAALRGFLLAALPWLLLGIIALILRGGELFMRLQEILAYTHSYQSYGLRTLGAGQGLNAHLLYYALPVAVLIVLGSALLRPRRHRPTVLAIAFFTAFFLVNLQRGLVRHSLAEGWDAALTSYGFFILAASVYVSGKTRSITRFFSFCIAGTMVILFLKYDRPAPDTNNRYAQVAERTFAQTNLFPAVVDRVKVSPEQTALASELKGLLDENFSDTATFLDFSNTPMLYAFTGRVVPNYFCQIPHTAHNGFLQERFLEALNAYDIPLVVFAHYPEGYWDALDGIPNAARHYRIAEYIYANYRPAWILGLHAVWLRKDITTPAEKEQVKLRLSDWTTCRVIQGFQADSVTLRGNGIPLEVEMPLPASGFSLKAGARYFIRLDGHAEGSGSAEVRVKVKGESQARVINWNLQWGYNRCFFPLELASSSAMLEQLSIKLPVQSFRMESLSLTETSRLPDGVSAAFRQWDLGLIPYYWGTYDRGVVTQSLELAGARTLAADAEVRYPLPPPGRQATYIDLDAGIEGDASANLIVSYGKGEEKLGAFILRMKAGEKARYRIRAISQYNWFSAQPDWVALYPAGNGIELQRLSLSTGE